LPRQFRREKTKLYWHPSYPFLGRGILSAPEYIVEDRGQFFEVQNHVIGWGFKKEYLGSTLALRQVTGGDEGLLRMILKVPEYAWP
jgi:hypothetical protein